jgi:probable HAF family extracellular repeat protein
MASYIYVTFDDPAADGLTQVEGINSLGQFVGAYADSNTVGHGFLYSNGIWTTLDDPSAGTSSGQGTLANGINASDQIAGTYIDSSGNYHGFLYSKGTWTTLDDPSAVGNTSATGINATGQIVGSYNDSSGIAHTFLYTNGDWTTLNDPSAGGGQGTLATGINDSGQIVGYYADSTGFIHGFLYSNGTWTTLNDPLAGTASGQGTVATGINDSGQIVGYYADSSNVVHGFLYGNGTWTTLDDPSANNYTAPTAISASGQIVGSYLDSDGQGDSFAAVTTVPFPLANANDVTEAVYIGYFGRAGDPVGDSYWLNQLNSGNISEAGMAASFSVQPETTAQYPFLASPSTASQTQITSFIESVYADLFNRAADSGGLAYWDNYLTTNLGNPQAVGAFILTVINGALGTDQTTIANKVTVADYFTQELTSAGISFSSAASTIAHSAIASVTSVSSTVLAAESTIGSWVATQPSSDEIGLVGTSHPGPLS